MTSLLIRNGTLVTASRETAGDVRCRDGRIVEVGPALEGVAGEDVIDAGGQYVFPGGVDPHVHMELPVAGTVSADDFESGTAAGIAGGTTTIIDFVHPERGENFLEALAARRAEAAKAVADYGLHMAVTWWDESAAAAMRGCVDEGVPSFKIYLAYKETVGIDDEVVNEVLRTAAGANGLVLVHAENGEEVERLRRDFAEQGKREPKYHALSRPPECEGEATARVAAIAGDTGARLYVVHVTCRESVQAIAAAKERGWRVYGETCPQYLLLDESEYDRPAFGGAAYVIAPPLRERSHQEDLWLAIENGTLEIVATDHCPFTTEQKRLGLDDFRKIPGGAPGIEHRLTLLYTHGVVTGRIGIPRFVELISTQPAKRFGLYPRKGSLEIGSDADLVVWDPDATGTISATTHRHRTDNSVYEGFRTQGAPSTVIAGGRIRLRDGDLRIERGAGRFLRRSLGD